MDSRGRLSLRQDLTIYAQSYIRRCRGRVSRPGRIALFLMRLRRIRNILGQKIRPLQCGLLVFAQNSSSRRERPACRSGRNGCSYICAMANSQPFHRQPGTAVPTFMRRYPASAQGRRIRTILLPYIPAFRKYETLTHSHRPHTPQSP